MFYVWKAQIFLFERVKNVVLVLFLRDKSMLALLECSQDEFDRFFDIFEFFLEVPGEHQQLALPIQIFYEYLYHLKDIYRNI